MRLKLWDNEFVFADRRKRAPRRYLFSPELKDFQRDKILSDRPLKRYLNPLRRALRWKAIMNGNRARLTPC